MNFGNLLIENFMSYRKPQVVNLRDQGLVLVVGDNQVSKVMDANAAGKTALIDAFTWVLKGMTLPRPQKPHGVGGSVLANRFTKSRCRVSLEIETPSGMHTATRFERPSGLLLKAGSIAELGDEALKATGEHQVEVQSVLDSMVPYGYLTVCNAMVFGQESFDRWARADQSDQLKMLDEMYGRDWRKCKQVAEQWRKRWDTSIMRMDAEQSSVHGQIQVDEMTVGMLEEARSKHAQSKQRLVLVAQAKLDRAELNEKANLKRRALLKAEMAKLANWRKAWTSVEERMKAEEDSSRRVVQANTAMAIAEGNAQRLGKDLVALLSAGKCPKCRRRLDDHMSQSYIKKAFVADVSVAQTQVAFARDMVAARQVELANAAKQTRIAQAFLPKDMDAAKLASLEAVAVRERRALDESHAEIVQEKADAVAELTEARSQKWDGAETLRITKARLADSQRRAAELALKLERADKGKRAAVYAVRAFGDQGIRNHLFDSIKGDLNAFLADHLEVLAGGEVVASADSQRMLKKGTSKAQVTISSQWEWGAGDYFGGSGGQNRRVDLGWFAALQDAAEASLAKPFPVKWYDQPDDNLDARGQEIFCDWIDKQRTKHGTTVVITHSADLLGMLKPDVVWRVVLERNAGSRIVCE